MRYLQGLWLAALLVLVAGCSSTSRYYSMEPREFRDIDYGYPVQYQQVRNLEIGYIDQGDGPKTLLLVHGLGSNAKGWSRNIDVLAGQYRVIALDLPGYGQSSKDFYPYSLTWYAQVLTEFMDELDIDEAVLVGHSMGGQIGIHTALAYPERVSELVLISPAGIEEFTDGEKDWFRSVAVPELTTDATVRTIDVNLKRNFYETPPEAEFMVTDRIQVRGARDFEDYAYAVSQNIKAMVNEPTTHRLGELDLPVLVLFGANDGLIPNPYLHGGSTTWVAEQAAELIPDATVRLFDETGHFVQFEAPERTNQAILSFLGNP